jgi:anti-sigma factor RsiW
MSAAGEISCRELVDLVTEFLEGALPAARLAEVEEHLVICEGCQAYVEQMRETIRVLRTAPVGELAPARRESLLEAFRGWAAGRPT